MKSLVNALDRPDFYFNLGATQDPRASLIGNVHFDKGKGTYFRVVICQNDTDGKRCNPLRRVNKGPS